MAKKVEGQQPQRQSQREHIDAALVHLAGAADLDGSDVSLWYRLACTAKATGRLKLARYALERGLATQPSHLPSLLALVPVLGSLGDEPARFRALKRLSRRDPRFLLPVAAVSSDNCMPSPPTDRVNGLIPQTSLPGRRAWRDHRDQGAAAGAFFDDAGGDELEAPRRVNLASPNWLDLGKLLLDIFDSLVQFSPREVSEEVFASLVVTKLSCGSLGTTFVIELDSSFAVNDDDDDDDDDDRKMSVEGENLIVDKASTGVDVDVQVLERVKVPVVGLG